MLDFSFISDEKPMHTRCLTHAGGIDYEEFIKAQDAQLIESHLDYYGSFRWSSQQVRQKRAMLTISLETEVPNLASIIKQAFAGGSGLVSIGD